MPDTTTPFRGLDQTSTDFLVGLKERSNDAWTRFVRVYVPVIREMCRRSLHDENDVDDVTATVIEKILKHVDGFERRGIGRFRGYVKRVTWSQVQNHFREQKRAENRQITKPVFDSKYSELLIRRIIAEVRRNRRFSDSSWRAFRIYVTETRCFRTIGADTGLTAAAAKKSVQRIVAAVKRELAAV